MKKLFFALLFFSTTSIMADQPIVLSPRHVQGTGTIGIDGLVYSQSYGSATISNAPEISSGSGHWLCDDFVLDGDYYVTDIYVSMIYMGAQASIFNLVISEDDTNDSNPNTNTDVWAESVQCTNTFTGQTMWGYDIFETHCTIDPGLYPELAEDLHYYFEIQAEVVDGSCVLCSLSYIGDYCWYDDGSGVWVRSDIYFGMDCDMFFAFYGEPVNAFVPETWGSIKTLF